MSHCVRVDCRSVPAQPIFEEVRRSTRISAGCGGEKSVHGHSCGPTDQKFIQTASTDMLGLGQLNADYQSGAAKPKDVSQQAFDASVRIQHADPKDPSLKTAQRYLDAMFQEYGTAVTIQAEGGDASERMYR